MVKHTQTIRRLLQANRLSVFDHFVGLALKRLSFVPTIPFRVNLDQKVQITKQYLRMLIRYKIFVFLNAILNILETLRITNVAQILQWKKGVNNSTCLSQHFYRHRIITIQDS